MPTSSLDPVVSRNDGIIVERIDAHTLSLIQRIFNIHIQSSFDSLQQTARKAPAPSVPTAELKSTQLYVLSSRKHRDVTKAALQRAINERDRANTAFLNAQQWLRDANDNITKLEEELKEAQEEYKEAKGLSYAQIADIEVEESEDEQPKKRSRKSNGGEGGKYKKSPLITDLLMDMAKSGQLVDGKKLHEVDVDVGTRDKAKFVNAMVLVEELWTEEEVRVD